MRRPARDERWADPDGNTWQVTEVKLWRVRRGRWTLAYVMVRDPASGTEARLNREALTGWARVTSDPLEGRRTEIAKTIRGGAELFTMPAPTKTPPVQKGEVYHLTCGRIEVESVTRKIVPGRGAEWQIKFIRHLKDRLYFLRSTVPGADPDELVKAPTASDIQHARIDGNYRTEPEHGGDPLPCVPPDWEDRSRMDRKVTHLKDRESVRAEDDLKRQRKAAKATLDATLSGLSPENQQRLLAQIINQCETAQMEKAA